jgi:hypothetical protein
MHGRLRLENARRPKRLTVRQQPLGQPAANRCDDVRSSGTVLNLAQFNSSVERPWFPPLANVYLVLAIPVASSENLAPSGQTIIDGGTFSIRAILTTARTVRRVGVVQQLNSTSKCNVRLIFSYTGWRAPVSLLPRFLYRYGGRRSLRLRLG